MARVLTWVSDRHLTGWACSACDWTFPLPSLLSDPEAKKAYDRLASAKFQLHDCAAHRQSAASLDPINFIARQSVLEVPAIRVSACRKRPIKPVAGLIG